MEVPFHKNIMGSFMVYQYRLETYSLELIARPENSEWFSIISVVVFEVNMAAEQKQFYKFSLPLTLLLRPSPPGLPVLWHPCLETIAANLAPVVSTLFLHCWEQV